MIYALCPITKVATGGVQVMYRHVDVLNKNGIPATIVHHQANYRANWFPNTTPITYWLSEQQFRFDVANDVVLLPEVFSKWIYQLPKMAKVMFTQSLSLTFAEYPGNYTVRPFYYHADVAGAICVSEEIQKYLAWTYPKLFLQRVYPGIDPTIFKPMGKKPQISFMPRKLPTHAVQIFNLLRHRGLLESFTIVPIEGVSRQQAAEVMAQSAMFFNFADIEGFSLPAAEAMACGCVVVGYHAIGGREYFLPEHSFPVNSGDILAYLQAAERAIDLFRTDRARFDAMGQAASNFVQDRYSLENEESSIVTAWKAILSRLRNGNGGRQ